VNVRVYIKVAVCVCVCVRDHTCDLCSIFQQLLIPHDHLLVVSQVVVEGHYVLQRLETPTWGGGGGRVPMLSGAYMHACRKCVLVCVC